jgi:hypothetical protein
MRWANIKPQNCNKLSLAPFKTVHLSFLLHYTLLNYFASYVEIFSLALYFQEIVVFVLQ